MVLRHRCDQSVTFLGLLDCLLDLGHGGWEIADALGHLEDDGCLVYLRVHFGFYYCFVIKLYRNSGTVVI